MKIRHVTKLDRIAELPAADRAVLDEVARRYTFRVNDYYLGLIDWQDPHDPIRQLIIPRAEELADWGRLDVSDEESNTQAPGIQHKYGDTALLLVSEVCGAYCRYCFRKRLFMDGNEEVSVDVSRGLDYIRKHPEISNVLLTGGDPLMLSTGRLAKIFAALRDIDHVRIIRMGSKMPAFDPWRILRDTELQALLREHSSGERRIYLMAHFDHPRELTDAAIEGIECYLANGCIAVNQFPIIRGVNDDVATLEELFRKLSWIGVPSYYVFQGRPTAGNEPYEVPLVEGFTLVDEARKRVSGLAKRARYVMSHASGKIEIVGIDTRFIYARYHRAKDFADEGRFMVFHRDDDAYWLDQLRPVEGLGTPREVEPDVEPRNHVPPQNGNGRSYALDAN